jgi:hypothetical protein
VAGKEQWLEKNSGWERAVAGEELWLETSYGKYEEEKITSMCTRNLGTVG